MTKPIELYFWPTPNGFKISIALEEMQLPYVVKPVAIGKGEQFAPAFMAISPNNRMPALVDPEGPGGAPISVFESGAILQYLGRKSRQFYPSDERVRTEVEQWLFWQMAGLGPMAGQASHFRNYAAKLVDDQTKVVYSLERYINEVDRLLGVLDRRLSDRDYIAGEYSIADMASWPWVRSARNSGQSQDGFSNLKAWYARVEARPGVQAGMKVGAELKAKALTAEEEAQSAKVLFGQTARSIADAAAAKQS